VSAFNNIVIQRRCPACSTQSTIRCISRVAASYDGREISFCLRDYQLGEKMPWFPPSDPRHATWTTADPRAGVVESCFAHCMNCHATLRVKIRFADLTPVEVTEISMLASRGEGPDLLEMPFNYVLAEAPCPACGKQSTIMCWTKIAATLENRLFRRAYRLGRRMAWFAHGHPRYDNWTPGEADKRIEVICPAICVSCKVRLDAKIAFEKITPVAMIDLRKTPISMPTLS
jgi:hypothetical protein